MRFATLSAALAFAASAVAQTAGFDPVTSPTQWEKVGAGKTFTIKWQPGDVKGTVTIGLIGGVAQNKQVPLSTIASGVDNQAGSFTWTVDASLGKDAVYGLKIALDSDPATFQYSFPFNIEASEAPAPSSSSAAAPASSAPAVSTKGGYETEPVPTTKPAPSAPATTATTAPSSTEPAPTTAASSPASSAPATTSVVKPTASYPASNTTAPASGSTTLSTATTSASATSSIVPVSGAGRVAAGSFLVGGIAALAAFL
jgi:hypothetical protein